MSRAMAASVQIVSVDISFAELLRAKLITWGIAANIGDEYLQSAQHGATEGKIDVLLLDVRQQGALVLSRLASAREAFSGLEIVLINSPDGISASMEGMRAGAADELTAPIDAATLKKKIFAAVRRRQKALKAAAGKKKSLVGMFEQAMAAATFAQAGEFDTALQMLDQEKVNEAGRGPVRKVRGLND